MLPQVASPGSKSQPVDVQIRYTTMHGALLRADGHTRPAGLDEIEALFGEYVLNTMMEKYGRWIDITVPQGVVVTAHVNGRVYTVHVVSVDAATADFLVDTDAGTITLPVNAPMFSLVDALNTATQHEPHATAATAPIHRCRCWSRRGGEIVVVILPGVGKREIAMENAAAHPELREIFNKVREAETEAHRWNGNTPPTNKAFVDLSDDEIESLVGRKPLPELRPITTRPLQLSHTAWGTNPAA
jgi:hypothetical protein